MAKALVLQFRTTMVSCKRILSVSAQLPFNYYLQVDFSQFDTRIFEYKTMISHKSILGKKKILSCFAVTGNRNGIIGKNDVNSYLISIWK
jgi:hypothetical protein